MRICIVGAGVGGAALARGLECDGHDVTVLERRVRGRRSGAAVTIYPNGAEAARRLGAELTGLGGEVDRLTIRRDTGARVLAFDLTVLARRLGHPVRTVPRRDLVERLAADVSIRAGVQVTSVDADAPRPGVRTSTGDVVEADVVVGADGYRSAVRSAALDAHPARPAGWSSWQGLTAVLPDIAGGRAGTLLVGSAGLVGLMPAGSGLTQWWFDVREDAETDVGPEAALERLAREFRGYADPVPELLAGIDPAELGRYPHVTHDVPEAWGRGAVTLLGDAAHVFPPSQAQGANQALEDAWLLRAALSGDMADVAGRLRRYERVRARRVRVVSGMAESERTNRPANPALAALTRLMPSGLAGSGYVRLVRRFSSVLSGDSL